VVFTPWVRQQFYRRLKWGTAFLRWHMYVLVFMLKSATTFVKISMDSAATGYD
jgi:hypothetical protein